MVSLPEQISACIARKRLFVSGQPILVAVSGGLDSMVLLHVLMELSAKMGWKLTVAHLNHQLRGHSSLADETFVRRMAAQWKLPVVVERADVRAFASRSKVSLEMAARTLRHEFLARAAVEHQIRAITLAHHLDDQVELFFLRLFRGSGIASLSGMKWVSRSPANTKLCLVRPLLDCPKSVLSKYAREHKISFREDSTNASLDIRRNRIRHELLPLLERHYQPGAARGIARTMDILAAESEFVNAAAESWLLKNANTDKERALTSQNINSAVRVSGGIDPFGELSNFGFEVLPVAVQRRCIQLQLLQLRVTPEFHLVERLRQFADQPIDVAKQHRMELCAERAELPTDDISNEDSSAGSGQPRSTITVTRGSNGFLSLMPGRPESFRDGCQGDSSSVSFTAGTGHLEWKGLILNWRVTRSGTKQPRKAGQTELFDADAVGTYIILRHWRAGDRFQPIGMKKAVKLQDLFVNHKVPRQKRHELAVATTAAGDLFWVEGLRMSERFKLTKATIRRLHWAWQRL